MEKTRVVLRDGLLAVSMPDEIIMETTPEIKDTVMRAIERHAPHTVVFDLSGTTFLDSVGIGMLASFNNRMSYLNKRLFLKKAGQRVMKPLEITQMAPLFSFIDDENEIGPKEAPND